jgi:Post-segregation antitoxin CcdA.
MICLKRMTTIRINPEILREAQNLGINISKFTENALKLAIKKMKEANSQIAGTGSNPAPALLTLTGRVLRSGCVGIKVRMWCGMF